MDLRRGSSPHNENIEFLPYYHYYYTCRLAFNWVFYLPPTLLSILTSIICIYLPLCTSVLGELMEPLSSSCAASLLPLSGPRQADGQPNLLPISYSRHSLATSNISSPPSSTSAATWTSTETWTSISTDYAPVDSVQARPQQPLSPSSRTYYACCAC